MKTLLCLCFAVVLIFGCMFAFFSFHVLTRTDVERALRGLIKSSNSTPSDSTPVNGTRANGTIIGTIDTNKIVSKINTKTTSPQVSFSPAPAFPPAPSMHSSEKKVPVFIPHIAGFSADRDANVKKMLSMFSNAQVVVGVRGLDDECLQLLYDNNIRIAETFYGGSNVDVGKIGYVCVFLKTLLQCKSAGSERCVWVEDDTLLTQSEASHVESAAVSKVFSTPICQIGIDITKGGVEDHIDVIRVDKIDAIFNLFKQGIDDPSDLMFKKNKFYTRGQQIGGLIGKHDPKTSVIRTQKSMPIVEYNARIENMGKKMFFVIPFRDREKHLEQFLTNLEKIKRKNWNPVVYVVEQSDKKPFNRGWLLNIGIHEIISNYGEDVCIITHDVDMIANPKVDYSWCDRPTQFCSELSCFNNGVPYSQNAGGVVGAMGYHWKQINGYTNKGIGWGGEDDILYHRFRQKKLLQTNTIRRPQRGFGKCKCLHDDDHTERVKVKKHHNRIVQDINKMARGKLQGDDDGLNSITYFILTNDKTGSVIHLKVEQKDSEQTAYNMDVLGQRKANADSKEEKVKGTCAIVFNSGVMLKSKHGRIIDSLDWQIRFNMIPTKGFEDFVGQRTTHQIVHFYSPSKKEKSPGQLFAELKYSNITGITFPIFDKEENGYNRLKSTTPSKWIQPAKKRLQECARKVGLKHGWCTSGMLGVLWAMDMCSHVTVFGVNHDPCYPYHYTDPMPRNCNYGTTKVNDFFKTHNHDFDAEHELLGKLHRDKIITLYS